MLHHFEPTIKKLMEIFDFDSGPKVAACNGEKDKVEEGEEQEELDKGEATKFRGAAALLNYYSQNCPGAQHSAKEASKDMAKPKLGSWGNIKRAVRFLMGREAVVWKFGWQAEGQEVRIFTDSDWGGSRADRRSTSGGGGFVW